MSAVKFLLQDFTQNRNLGRSGYVQTFLTLRYASVFWFRVAQLLGTHFGFAASLIKQVNNMISGADLAWQASVGAGLVLYHPSSVVIGPHVSIGERVSIQSSVTIGAGAAGNGGFGDSPSIGDDVELGSGARIIGPVTIGSRTTVGANSVVTKSVPPDSVAVGVPAIFRPKKEGR